MLPILMTLMQALRHLVEFEKQDKKIKEEEKKALPLKSSERRISVHEVKEQKFKDKSSELTVTSASGVRTNKSRC